MNLTGWTGKKVKIGLEENGKIYFYIGVIKAQDSDSIKFNDRYKGDMIIKKDQITKIEEAGNHA